MSIKETIHYKFSSDFRKILGLLSNQIIWNLSICFFTLGFPPWFDVISVVLKWNLFTSTTRSRFFDTIQTTKTNRKGPHKNAQFCSKLNHRGENLFFYFTLLQGVWRMDDSFCQGKFIVFISTYNDEKYWFGLKSVTKKIGLHIKSEWVTCILRAFMSYRPPASLTSYQKIILHQLLRNICEHNFLIIPYIFITG